VARGEQEYVARGRARRELSRVSREMPGASIIDRTRRAAAPTTEFEFVPGVFPLRAGRSAAPGLRRGKRSGPRRGRADTAEEGERRRDAAAAQAATPTAAPYPRPSGRGLLQELGAHTAGSLLAAVAAAAWRARRNRRAKKGGLGAETPPADHS
jgi:hypothetical protein